MFTIHLLFNYFVYICTRNPKGKRTYLLYSLSFTTTRKEQMHIKELPHMGADFSRICAWFVVNREAYGEGLRLLFNIKN